MAYATTDGHTLAVCRRILEILQLQGLAVTLIPVEEALHIDCRGFDRVVLGASIRYGRHSQSVYDFVLKHRQALSTVHGAFFSVSAVARKEGKNTPATNPYFKKFVRRSHWTPSLAATFGGRIDYSKYGLADRWMIRLIMWLTKGPTDLNSAVEFTDWHAVEDFAQSIAQTSQQAPENATDRAFPKNAN